MSPSLLYVLIALNGPDWHGALTLKEFKEAGRCEAVLQQLEKVEQGERRYRCMTLVINGAKAK